ncbi:hypothetical protein BBP40_000150 [Aspergillus hancockii]|nr:hypothetical protein BBP40_000150 [Aspergillus hancockii]
MTRYDWAPTAPYSEPLLPQLDIQSPYYTDLHHSLRAYVRDYVESSIAPYAHEWEATGQVPESVRRRHCELGFGIVHPLTTLEDAAGLSLPNNVPRENWDTWCNLIVADELTRIGTTAKREGDHYIVNGAKKWITNGIWADYCTAAVRTGGPGKNGISLLVIPLAASGVTRRRMYNSGVHASGSTFIELDDVKVPVDYLLGRENKGFPLIMSNFNPERLSLACASLRLARVCAEDAFHYAVQRETFGSPLIQRQAIQLKISKFGLMIEPAYAFMEQLVHIIELTKDRLNDDVRIGGMTALLKVMSTRALEKSVREAQQILGGAGYNKAGKGARIEQISRDVRVHVVGGGSEEIMMGLALQEETKALRTRRKALDKKARF